jgi:enamine deaminase RidA (YjgF/YER057c/UK114 family)
MTLAGLAQGSFHAVAARVLERPVAHLLAASNSAGKAELVFILRSPHLLDGSPRGLTGKIAGANLLKAGAAHARSTPLDVHKNMLTEVIMRRVSSALILGACWASAFAFAGARQDAKVLMAPDPASLKLQQDWGFSDAVVTGDTIYLSGVVAGVREGETDLKLGYTRAFERISAILKDAGASWDDVVDLTSFHTDLTTQMPAMVAVKNNYVKQPFPAWTAIQVSRLIPTNGITEIKIVAKIRHAR